MTSSIQKKYSLTIASETAYQPPAAAERARIDGPPARHSAADSVSQA